MAGGLRVRRLFFAPEWNRLSGFDTRFLTGPVQRGNFQVGGNADFMRFRAYEYTGRGVAQPGSALSWGDRGRWFKSSRPDHTDDGLRFSTVARFYMLTSDGSKQF